MKTASLLNSIAAIVLSSTIAARPSVAGNLPTKFNQLDSFVIREMKDAHVPGLALVVTRNGAVVFEKGYGEARPGIPVDQDTPFALGSISKGMTAMGLMTLVEEGIIDPALPVRVYLPDFKTADPRSGAITVNNLLTHTSGFSTRDGRDVLSAPKTCSINSLMKKLSSIRLSSPPGTRFEYSNWNYIAVGAIIENVSGKSYATFMKERVFGPIGMTRTVATHEEAERELVAIGSRSFLGFNLRGFVPCPPGSAPAGGIVSTAHDMGNYLSTIQMDGLSPRGMRVLSPIGIQTITTTRPPSLCYGYGWGIGDEAIYHAGDTAEFHADAYTQRKGTEQWGVAILCGKTDYLADTVDQQGSFQSRILRGVLGILSNGVSMLPPPHAGMRRSILLAIMLLLLAAAVCSLLSLRHWVGRRALSIGKARIVLAFVLHLALPLVIFLGLPILAESKWSLLLVWVPDAGWILGGFALLEFTVGAAKAGITLSRRLENIQKINA